MNFRYRARTADGQIIEGYAEADDQKSALKTLRDRGMIVINLNAQGSLASTDKKKSGGSMKSLLSMDLGALFSGGRT